MTWFKVDDKLHAHPKAALAGNAALGLWVRCGAWSSDHLTDGHIPVEIVRQYGTVTQARQLVNVGLWDEAAGGYQFHDWGDMQPTGEESEALRRKRSEAGRKGAAKRWARQTDSKSHSKPVANAMANQCPDPDPVPVVVVKVPSRLSLADASHNDDVDLDKISRALHSDQAHAFKVAREIIDRSTQTVRDPTAYVLRAIGQEPERYKPTPTPAPPPPRLVGAPPPPDWRTQGATA